MTNTQSAVIERVRKLMALSESSNVHEAAAAAARAQALMTEHKLAMTDLEIEEEEASPIECMEALDADQKEATGWQVQLLSGCARANSCRITIRAASRRFRVRGSLRVYGRRADIDASLYMYLCLRSEIERLCDAWTALTGADRGARGSFRLGAAVEIRERLIRAREERAEAATASTALVHLRNMDAQVQAHVDQISSGTWAGGGSTSDWAGFHAGKRAASGVAIDFNSKGEIGAAPRRIRGGA